MSTTSTTSQNGFYLIVAGVPGECFSTPNIAAVNMGPRYSDIGAAQALVRHGAKSLVISSPAAIADYANGGVLLVAKAAGLKGISDGQNLPITDPNSIILKLVQEAGPGGGIILDYTPESAAPLMKAAEAQGVVDKVLWPSTPIANEFTASQVGSVWNAATSSSTPSSPSSTRASRTRTSTRQSRRSTHRRSRAELRTDGVHGRQVRHDRPGAPRTSSPVRASTPRFRTLKNFQTDILCKPWYFGKPGVPHPEQHDITVSYENGKSIQTEECFGSRPSTRAHPDPQVGEAVQPEPGYFMAAGPPVSRREP